jgi:hypothetical protein
MSVDGKNLHGPLGSNKLLSYHHEGDNVVVTIYKLNDVGDIEEGFSVRAMTNKPGTYEKSG